MTGESDQPLRGEAIGVIEVPARFEGPPGLGHGGWAVWLLQDLVDRPLSVALRSPIPLAAPLVVLDDGNRVRVIHNNADGPRVVLEGTNWLPDVPRTDAVTPGEAAAARARFPIAPESHPLPRCFVCGTAHDSQHIHAGPLADGRFACDWQVPLAGDFDSAGQGDLHGDSGNAPIERSAGENERTGLAFGVLDCSAHWYVSCRQPFRQAFTVQFAVDLRRPVEPGEQCAVVAWAGDYPPSWDGRKAGAASALFDADGDLIASARSFWVAAR